MTSQPTLHLSTGVAIDMETAMRLLTEQLRAGVVVTIVAQQPDGAELRFGITRVDGGDQPAEPAAPELLAAPTLRGSGEIGLAVTVDLGAWAGEPVPVPEPQWQRDGANISGATGPSYTPVAEDDRTALSCKVTATNSAGSASANTAMLAVTHVAPVAIGDLADVTLTQGDEAARFPTADAFTGDDLSFAVIGASATIGGRGVVTIPTAAPFSGEVVTVTASNSGGSASVSFIVTILERAGYSLTDPRLSFRPPEQSSPVTHALSTNYWRNDGASGRPGAFKTTADIIITANAATRTGRAIVDGGRHVRWIGGRHVVTEKASSSRALQAVNIANEGSIFVEGQYIDLTGTVEMDAMAFGGTSRFTSPQTRFADVYVQNCKILGVHGTFDTLHADCYQHDYGVRNLRFDRCDFSSRYQGVFMRQLMSPNGNPIKGEVVFRRCYFARSLTPAGDPTNTLSHIYFALNSAELDALPTERIELTDVWVQINGADDPKLAIRPASASATGADSTSAYIHWPDRPKRIVDAYGNPAKVRIGTPPGGGFVKSDDVGLNYTSPGYLG